MIFNFQRASNSHVDDDSYIFMKKKNSNAYSTYQRKNYPEIAFKLFDN